jgi:hypothetical protein
VELLERLLEAHERSVSYGKPGPWPRDVILKLDARTFPADFAPDGRERRASLWATVLELEAERRIRVVRHARGPLAGEPSEVRLGPNEVERAYEAARALGYEPLSFGLDQIARHASGLIVEPSTSWMQQYLENVANGMRRADPSCLGMSRERFRRDWRDLVPVLTAATGLARGVTPAWERVVSDRLLDDSKLLGRVRSLVVAVLVGADPRWQGLPPDEAGDLLEVYGVRRKPGLIRCAGVAALRVGTTVYRIEDFDPVAHLPDRWSEGWVEGLLEAGVRQVTTIENEFPFLAYVEESGGAAGLGRRGEVAVYTAGFPTPSLVTALSSLARRAADASFRHWGDADVGGFRIWSFLRTRLERDLDWFRTTAAWIAAEGRDGGKSLSGSERAALARLHTELTGVDGLGATAARDAIAAMLSMGVKLEQERW